MRGDIRPSRSKEIGMPRPTALEHNLQVLVEAKVLNIDVTMGSLVKAGALSDLDPWDIWCGNGWIIRRRGPTVSGGLGPEFVRNIVRDELLNAGVIKG